MWVTNHPGLYCMAILPLPSKLETTAGHHCWAGHQPTGVGDMEQTIICLNLSGWPAQFFGGTTDHILSQLNTKLVWQITRAATFTHFFLSNLKPERYKNWYKIIMSHYATEHTIAETNLAATTGYQLQAGIEKKKKWKLITLLFIECQLKNYLGHDIKIELWLKT